jgi:hypothetical protein
VSSTPFLDDSGKQKPGDNILSNRLSHAGSCTPHEVKDYRYYGKNQKNVDEEGRDMKDEKSA